jgi:hypothetical protein
MTSELFDTMDIVQARCLLPSLHTQILERSGRVQIIDPKTREVCVLLSKAELDGLERALDFLSQGAPYRLAEATISGLLLDEPVPAEQAG